MDAFVVNVLGGVISNACYTILAHVTREASLKIESKEFREKYILEKQSFCGIINKCIKDIAEISDWKWEGPPRYEIVCNFLEEPEVLEIIRQIFAASFLDKSNLEAIRKEFLNSLSFYSDTEPQLLGQSASKLFDILVQGCDRALSSFVDQGILSAHEAKSNARYQILVDYISNIKKNQDLLISLLAKPSNATIQDYRGYEREYRNQVNYKHSTIIPPYYRESTQLSVEKIYVSPTITSSSLIKGDEAPKLSLDVFFANIYRTVLLGNPGGGKSTLTTKLCYELTKQNLSDLQERTQKTPIHIIIKDYGVEKKRTSNCSLLGFIQAKAKSTYQTDTPPDQFFEYLLLNGKAIVIFDGLDELLDTTYRIEISKDIELFCNLYPTIPVLITSRQVGYDQAPLNPKIFEIFLLDNFDKHQVSDYVTKWFNADTDLTQETKDAKIKAFLQNSEIVKDLRSNPLMLALMCHIYKVENYIPQNRPEVYEICTTILFEKWDARRNIEVPFPYKTLNPMLQFVAHWIYTSDDLKEGVTEQKLINKAQEYLYPQVYEDIDVAYSVAQEFVEYCIGRAWVFRDVGTTRDGHKIYQFTHQTFLEYFTAYYLVRKNETICQLWSVIKSKIFKGEWDVVAQLACLIKERVTDKAIDKVFEFIVEESKINLLERLNLLSFGVRCIEFTAPSPFFLRRLTEACVSHCIYLALINKSPSKFNLDPHVRHMIHESDSVNTLLCPLLFLVDTNYLVVKDSIVKSLSDAILSADIDNRVVAAQISDSIRLESGSLKSKRHVNIARDIFQEIEEIVFNKQPIIYSEDPIVCQNALFQGKVSLDDYIRWHGIEHVLIDHNRYNNKGTGRCSISLWLLLAILDPRQKELNQIFNKIIEQLSVFLINSGLPLKINKKNVITNTKHHLVFLTRVIRAETMKKEEFKFDERYLFYVFLIFAIYYEIYEEQLNNFFYDAIFVDYKRLEDNMDRNKIIEIMSQLINIRKSSLSKQMPLIDDTKEIIGRLKLDDQQSRFLSDWVKGNVSFFSKH
jgi:NACHT domain